MVTEVTLRINCLIKINTFRFFFTSMTECLPIGIKEFFLVSKADWESVLDVRFGQLPLLQDVEQEEILVHREHWAGEQYVECTPVVQQAPACGAVQCVGATTRGLDAADRGQLWCCEWLVLHAVKHLTAQLRLEVQHIDRLPEGHICTGSKSVLPHSLLTNLFYFMLLASMTWCKWCMLSIKTSC